MLHCFCYAIAGVVGRLSAIFRYQELIGTELALEGRWNEWLQHLPFLYLKNDRGSHGEKDYSPSCSWSAGTFLAHGGVRTPWSWSWYE